MLSVFFMWTETVIRELLILLLDPYTLFEPPAPQPLLVLTVKIART